VNTLFDVHRDLPLLIVLVGLIALVWFIVRWRQRKPYDRASGLLMMAFTRLLEIQMLLGLIYLIWNGIDADYWPAKRFGHMAVMIVVVFFAHLPDRWSDVADSLRYRNNILVLISALLLGFVGVSFVAD
jgi:hypothetical protein